MATARSFQPARHSMVKPISMAVSFIDRSRQIRILPSQSLMYAFVEQIELPVKRALRRVKAAFLLIKLQNI
jgi:hypothetical protein